MKQKFFLISNDFYFITKIREVAKSSDTTITRIRDRVLKDVINFFDDVKSEQIIFWELSDSTVTLLEEVSKHKLAPSLACYAFLAHTEKELFNRCECINSFKKFEAMPRSKFFNELPGMLAR